MSSVEVVPIGESWGVGGDDWTRLFVGAPEAAAYLSPEWTRAWLQEFMPTLRPVQIVVRDDDGEPIATCLLTERRLGLWPVQLRRMFVNTDGEDSADSVVIEHNGLLYSDRREREAYRLLGNFIRGSKIDELRLSGGSESAVRLLAESLPDWRIDIEWRESPYVDLSSLREAGVGHRGVVSASTRAQLTKSIRKYELRGPLRIELARTAEDGLAFFDGLLELHNQRWRARRESGAFASPRRQRFHRRFIFENVVTGRAHLMKVMNGEHTIGYLYNIVANGRVAFYQCGFLYEEDPSLKPGLVTHHLAIGHYLSAGFLEYDFLPSAPGDGRYKQSLANATRRVGTVTLYRRSWRNRAFEILRNLRRIRPLNCRAQENPSQLSID